jgi:hypothetical protein
MKPLFLTCLMVGFLAVATPAQTGFPIERGAIVAHHLQIVSSEFVVDVYQNGKLVPAKQHTLEKEIYGAQIEQVDLVIREGDWIVFHVVNNDLRGSNFPRYFVVAGMLDDKHVAFVSETLSGTWFVCDNLANVAQFIADRDDRGDGPAHRLTVHWTDGDKEISERVPDWNGDPIWGTSHEPWIKYIVAPAKIH